MTQRLFSFALHAALRTRPAAPPVAAALSRPISGVLFDAGGVLYDDSAWRRWLLRLLRQLGLQSHYRSFSCLWEHEYLDRVHRGEAGFAEALHAFLRAAGLSAAQSDEVEAACQARRRLLERNIRPLPGVKTTLARLQLGGMRLGVLANCEQSAAALAERLERIGLGGLFGTVISSLDLGATLPDRTCYRAALESLGLPAEKVALVGHDSRELAGARAAGLATVAFNFDPDAAADVRIARFDELADVLATSAAYRAAG